MENEKLRHSEITSDVLNCFFATYNRLGFGFTKSIYKEALQTCLNQTKIKHKKDKPIDIKYEMDVVGLIELDFVVEEKVVLLITATNKLEPREVKRLFSFLKQSPYRVGLILNYGETPGYKRRELLA